MSDYTDYQEEGEEVDHDMDNMEAARRKINSLKDNIFFLALTLGVSVFFNVILVIKYKL